MSKANAFSLELLTVEPTSLWGHPLISEVSKTGQEITWFAQAPEPGSGGGLSHTWGMALATTVTHNIQTQHYQKELSEFSSQRALVRLTLRIKVKFLKLALPNWKMAGVWERSNRSKLQLSLS